MRITTVLHDALVAGIEKLSLVSNISYDPITFATALGQFIRQLSLSDSSATLDELAKGFFKSISDDSAAIDAAVISFGKVIADSSDVTEQALIHFTKSLAEIAGVGESTTLSVNKDLADSASSLDELVKGLVKGILDNSTAADTSVMAVGKNLLDTPNTLEEVVLSVFRELVESASSLDDLVKSLSKQFTDESSFVDQVVSVFSKAINDQAGISEQTVLDVTKSLSELSTASDVTVLSANKVSSDATETAETITVLLDKYLLDTVYATDDIDGEATLEDDQEMYFNKVRSEATFATEVFSRVSQYSREYNDTSAASDLIANKVFKVLSDVVSAVESLDSQLVVNETATDSGGVSETLSVILAKVLLDEPVTADEILFDVVKHLSDTATGSEIVALSFSTSRADSSTIVDNTLKLPIKSLSDSGNASDAGSYRGQGYSDFDYFLEDYVGYSGVF